MYKYSLILGLFKFDKDEMPFENYMIMECKTSLKLNTYCMS